MKDYRTQRLRRRRQTSMAKGHRTEVKDRRSKIRSHRPRVKDKRRRTEGQVRSQRSVIKGDGMYWSRVKGQRFTQIEKKNIYVNSKETK